MTIIINEQLLDEVTRRAQSSPRLRMNFRFQVSSFRFQEFKVQSLKFQVSGLVSHFSLLIARSSLLFAEVLGGNLHTTADGTERDVINLVKELILVYVFPEVIVHLKAMPFNMNGNIDRVLLYKMYKNEN